MTINETEHVRLDAYFVEVLCSDEKCRPHGFGEKTLLKNHKGYRSNEDFPINNEDMDNALKVAKDHDQIYPKHNIRVVVGENSDLPDERFR